jgi:hypothetical protein
MNGKMLGLVILCAVFMLAACSAPSDIPDPSAPVSKTGTFTPPPALNVAPPLPLPSLGYANIVHYDPFESNFMPNDDNFSRLLPQKQALEDFYYLWDILEKNAPYFSEISSMAVFRHYAGEIYKTDAIYTSRFTNLVSHALQKIGYTGPVYPVADFYRNLRIAFPEVNDRNPLEPQTTNDRLSGFIHAPKTVALYQNLFGISDADSPDDGMTAAAEYDTQELAEYYEHYVQYDMINGVPYIKIQAFDGVPSSYMIEQLRMFCSDNQNANDIIIDIRGNAWGDSNIWINGLIEPLVSSSITYYQLCATINGSLNTYLSDGESVSELPDEWRELFPYIGDVSRFDAFSLDEMVINEEGNAGVGFNGKVWLLVDESVSLAAEHLTMFCKQTKFATVIGTRTAGTGIDKPSYLFPLPNSGLLIFYQPWYAFNEDGTCNQIVGTLPDIDVRDRDALEVCLEQIAAR